MQVSYHFDESQADNTIALNIRYPQGTDHKLSNTLERSKGDYSKACQPRFTHLTMFRWMMGGIHPLACLREKQTGLKDMNK